MKSGKSVSVVFYKNPKVVNFYVIDEDGIATEVNVENVVNLDVLRLDDYVEGVASKG